MSDQYALAAGHDVPLVSLVRVTALSIPGAQALGDPKALPKWDDGEIKTRLNDAIDPIGYSAVTWEFGILLYEQYSYLRTTYCSGGLSGEVTIYTTVKGSTTYTRYNATMKLKPPSAMNGDNWFKPGEVTFTKLQVAA